MHLKKYMYKVWLFFIVLITVYSMPYAAHAAISGVATFNFTGNGRAATDCGDYLYMLTESPAKVIKLDKNTMTQVDETVGLAGGNGIAITNDGSYLYVLTYNGSSLSSSMSKVDMNTMGVVTTVDSLCSGEVWGITVYDNYLYLATKTSPAKVIKMDTTTMAVDKSGDLTAGNARAVTNDGNYMYVVTETSPTRVIKVNMGTMSQVGEPVELAGGKGMAVTRDDTHLYVVNYTSPSSSVTKVQMSDMQDGAVTLTGIPYAHVVTSDDIYLYVATFTDPVTVIKVNKSDITSSSTYTQNTVENIKSATAFTCDDKYLYMVTYSPGKVIKLPKNTAEASAASLTPEAGTDNTIALTVKDTLGNADTDFDGDKTVTVTGYEAAPDGTYGSFGGTALEADGSTDVTVSFADGVGTPSLALNKADEQTIGFSISGVNAPGASVTITPAAAPAASMELTQDITAPASNGGQFAQQPVITLKDTYGNTCAGDSSTQVTASEKESGNWILTGTVTKTASNGVVTFTGLGATNTAQVNNAQLAFNAAGLTEVVSVTVTLPAPAGAQTATALAAEATPAAGANNTITLTVKNALGNTDTGFDGARDVTISGVTAAPDGTYGSFNATALDTASAGAGQTISVDFANGQATADLALNDAGTQNLAFSIVGVATPSTNTLTITPTAGTAGSMSLTTDITAPATNGGQFAQQPVITLKDTYGNTCAGDSSTQVTASEKESGNWILTGTVTKTASNGVVTFTGLGATNTAQVNNAQLAFNAAGLTEVVSVTVTLPAPAGAQTATALAAEATPAAGANNTITLTVKNALGNTDTGFDGARDVTISGVTAAPDGTYGSFNATALDTASAGAGQTISVDFANGQAAADLALNDAGTQNLAFSIVGVATPSTNTLTITPTAGTAGSMSLTTDITAPATNGGQFAQQPVITLKDAYSNTCAGNNSTQVTASKNDAGNWALTGTDTVTADNGIVTFTDLGASNAARVDNAQLAFNATGLSQITSSPVLLSPPGLSITNNSLPHGTVGEYYSATLAASGGTAPYTWIITGLPAELSYSTVQGTVYGTPVSTGEYSVSAAVYDNYSQNAGKNFILSIDNSPAVRVTGIALNKNSLILTAGGANETLTYTITPANASNQSVTWHSSNPSVATAVYGVVTPKAAGTIGVTVTTTDGDFTDTCSVTVNAQSSGSGNHRDSGSGRNNSNNDHTSTPNNISINGRELQGLGRTVTTYENGQAVTTVTVDQQRIEQALESEGNNAVVTIFTNADSDKVIGELNGQTVKSMEQKQAVLNVSTGDASYTLSAAQINIDAVSEQIGQQVELKDIKVTVEISKTPNEVKIIENDAEQGGYTIVAPPVSFDITCTYGNKSIQVDKFNSYVERTIAIPEGVDPQKITTGVIVNPDGTLSHVPTQIVVIDGKYYAKINSLTNSTYSVIWNPVVFSDVTNHWAKEPVNEMGSRKVIGGIGDNKFAPDREITRAEFASITIRALGLVENDNKNTFKDVKESDWFSGAVSKTNEYGLISGYTDGTFRPHNKITREEAMAIISKTMNLVGIDTDTTDTETQLANFKDRDKIGGWAKDAVAACIKNNITKGSSKMLNPKDNITRAETAATVMRLLQEAELI